MPIVRESYQDTLRLRFNFGQDEEGQDILRTRSYTRAKHTADDETLFSLAEGFDKLFAADEMVNVYRVMHVELVKEP